MSAPSQIDELGSLLGTRLRERRRELGRTLAEVARSAGLSAGYLSSIEKGAGVPSLPVLARLAHTLEISLAEVLRTSASARLARGNLDEGRKTSPLAAHGSRLQIVKRRSKPGETGAAPVTLAAGDVFLFVATGALEVVVDGDTFDLAQGDALHCDVPGTVRWRSTGDRETVALWATPARHPAG